MLLGAHRELLCVGELQKLSLQLSRETVPYPGVCSCGKRPFDCDRWRPVFEAVRATYGVDMVQSPFAFRVSDIGKEEDFGVRAFPHWLLHMSARALRYLAYSSIGTSTGAARWLPFNRKWVANRLFVAQTLLETTGARGVIDSSKDGIGMRDLVTECREPLKVIFLTRDPYSSAHSTMKRGRGDAASAAADWTRVNGTIMNLLDGVPRDQWTHLKYEDLCADPGATARRLCEFLGYGFDPKMLDLARMDHHTIGGNAIRFKPIGGIKADDGWKARLSQEEVRSIDAATGTLARRLGYESPVTSSPQVTR
jgi:hypothetical protein